MSITLQGAGDKPGSLRHLGECKYAYRPTRSKRDGENPVQMEEIITVKGSCWKEPWNRALLEQPGNAIHVRTVGQGTVRTAWEAIFAFRCRNVQTLPQWTTASTQDPKGKKYS